MNMRKIGLTLVVCSLMLPLDGLADGRRMFHVHNFLRVEYDDNIYERDDNKESSLKIIEEVEFLFGLNLENTTLNVRYKPSFVYWENRDEDSTDIHHEFDLALTHAFTPRVTLRASNIFRISELPELLAEEDALIRQKGDYLYNSTRVALLYDVTPSGRIDVATRYTLIRYDEDVVADRSDYDQYSVGASYRHRLLPETSLSGDLRFESIEYSENTTFDRGSDTVSMGFGVEHMFSPHMVGSFSAGLSQREFNDSDVSSNTEPYGSVNIVASPTPTTRFSLGGSYSMLAADIFPYASRDTLRVFAGVTHDVTARVAFNLSGSYARSNYDRSDAIPTALAEAGLTPDDLEDASEDSVTVGARVTYQINNRNSLEASWRLISYDSDLRPDADRNRISLGWKVRI